MWKWLQIFCRQESQGVEEEATTIFLEQEGERMGLTTCANMVWSRAVGGESSALDVLCEVLVFRVRTTKNNDDDDDDELILLLNKNMMI
jgi:hypothetical protein